jgi:hypothetical protein
MSNPQQDSSLPNSGASVPGPERFSGWARHIRNSAALAAAASVVTALLTFAVSKSVTDPSVPIPTALSFGMLFATGFFTATNLWFMVALMGFGLRSAQYVRARGVNTRLKPGWAIGGWFIPIGQLILPYLALVDVFGVGAGEQAAARKRSLVWFWIWFTVLNQVASYSFGDIISSDLATQFQGYQIYAGALAFNIVPLMMARKVFAEVTADLQGLAR